MDIEFEFDLARPLPYDRPVPSVQEHSHMNSHPRSSPG